MARETNGVGPKYPQSLFCSAQPVTWLSVSLSPDSFTYHPPHLSQIARIVGTSLTTLTVEEFQNLCLEALTDFSARKMDPEAWEDFKNRLDYVPLSAGAEGLKKAVR
jgi:glucose-6-phosphate 1-dehydrogenase